MNILFFCPRWGSEDIKWDKFCRNVKDRGYNGVETGLPFEEGEKYSILESAHKYGLKIICQYYQSFESDFALHKENFEKHLLNLVEAKPVLINSQTGKDYFTFDQNLQLIELAKKIEEGHSIKITHETHRNKFNFAAHITKEYLEKIPYLRLTLDISHWCNVHESFLDDQVSAIDLAIGRTDHVHTRVGHPEGPQVNDPRAPEWKQAFDCHLNWWDQIINLKKKNNEIEFTMTPEFGPADYMPTVPYTRQPIANQWEINAYMMDLLRKRYL